MKPNWISCKERLPGDEDPPGSGKLSGYSTHISIIDEGVNK